MANYQISAPYWPILASYEAILVRNGECPIFSRVQKNVYNALQGFTLYLKTAGPLPESVLAKAKTAV